MNCSEDDSYWPNKSRRYQCRLQTGFYPQYRVPFVTPATTGVRIKTSKGEISISNFEERIRLKWRYAGERYSLNLPYAYLPENLHQGAIKDTEIKLDILKGCFDSYPGKVQAFPYCQVRSD
jgi:hypothetical protein